MNDLRRAIPSWLTFTVISAFVLYPAAIWLCVNLMFPPSTAESTVIAPDESGKKAPDALKGPAAANAREGRP